MRLSMDALATKAGISRSTLHRFEHGHPIQLTPANAARVLTEVQITAEEAEQLVKPCDWRNELLIWMRRSDVEEAVRTQPRNGVVPLDFSLMAWRSAPLCGHAGTAPRR
jgi:transcriptional regulator with XRE-family HTH domain